MHVYALLQAPRDVITFNWHRCSVDLVDARCAPAGVGYAKGGRRRGLGESKSGETASAARERSVPAGMSTADRAAGITPGTTVHAHMQGHEQPEGQSSAGEAGMS